MQNYPHLDHISQVLPAIEGRGEFIVADKGDYQVINYNVELPDTFDIDENHTLKDASGNELPVGMFRRECRGLIFDAKGKLISRPFHKFFNIGQRAETMPNKLDFRVPHIRFEKMDGSMIRPFFDGTDIVPGTKMGFTDVAQQPFEWIKNHAKCHEIVDFWETCIRNFNQTPLLEWVSPDNNIVVRYEEPKLVQLAMRDMFTGEYRYDFTCDELEACPVHEAIEDFDAYLEATKDDTDREGDIIVWPSLGLKVKQKNDWYVTIHRAKDDIANDRKLLKVILDNEIDDILPKLDAATVDRVNDFAAEFWVKFEKKMEQLDHDIATAIMEYGHDNKQIALNVIPNVHKRDSQFYFGVLKGGFIRDLMMRFVKNMTNNGRNYDELMEWIE